MRFYPGQVVVYKSKKYVIVLTPVHFKLRTEAGWVPGYLYVSTDGSGHFGRREDDMEMKFKEA